MPLELVDVADIISLPLCDLLKTGEVAAFSRCSKSGSARFGIFQFLEYLREVWVDSRSHNL